MCQKGSHPACSPAWCCHPAQNGDLCHCLPLRPGGAQHPAPLKAVGRLSFPSGVLPTGWEGRAGGGGRNSAYSAPVGASRTSGDRLEQAQPRGRATLVPAELGFGGGHCALVPCGARAFGTGCLWRGRSAVVPQGSGACRAVGGTSGRHLWVGWGCLSRPGCGDGTSLGRSLPFPAERGWENTSRGNAVPGRNTLTGEPGIFPAQALPTAPVPPLCHGPRVVTARRRCDSV